MRKIRIGLFGTGHLGKIHLKLLKELQEFEVIGFYDVDAAVQSSVEKEFGVKAFSKPEELMKEVEAVDIVTPTLNHHALAKSALSKGKHVFIEKPITETVAEAKELEALVKRTGLKFQVGHVERFNPAFLAVKDMLGSPMFIETHRLAQFNPRGTDVSVVLDLMIHDIDIALTVIPSKVKEVYASGVSIVSDTPDISNARIEFENGAVANLTASRISMKNMRKSRFFQPGAYISVDFLERKTELIKVKSIEKEPEDPFAITVDIPGKGMKQLFFEAQSPEQGNAIRAELASFGESILHNTLEKVSVSEGRSALELAYRIMEKMKVTRN